MNTTLDNHDSRAEIATKGLDARGNLTAVEAPTPVRGTDSNGDGKIPTGSPPNTGAAKKRLRRTLAAAAVLIVALAAGVYYFRFVAPFESTDNAFIEGNVIPIAPKVPGYVAELPIQDNQAVKKGQLLVQIDPRDYEVALRSAEAHYDKAKSDYDRDVVLVGSNAISKQDLDTARAAYEEASAQLDQAKLNMEYARITAPEDGRVTRRVVEQGAYVQPGQALLAIVPRHYWVIANFKEIQLTHMRLGQPVEVVVDAYPDRKFNGHVESIQSGAGARFSLFPPENATGNYIKVVQRVPVKIVFDDPPDVQLALGPGMSVSPTVRVK